MPVHPLTHMYAYRLGRHDPHRAVIMFWDGISISMPAVASDALPRIRHHAYESSAYLVRGSGGPPWPQICTLDSGDGRFVAMDTSQSHGACLTTNLLWKSKYLESEWIASCVSIVRVFPLLDVRYNGVLVTTIYISLSCPQSPPNPAARVYVRRHACLYARLYARLYTRLRT